MYKKILVATDGTKLSRKAVEAASELAVDFDAVLTIVRVVPPYQKTFFGGSSMLSIKEMTAIEKEWEDKARASLNQLLKTAVDKHISINTVVTESGNVSDALLKVAKKSEEPFRSARCPACQWW